MSKKAKDQKIEDKTLTNEDIFHLAKIFDLFAEADNNIDINPAIRASGKTCSPKS